MKSSEKPIDKVDQMFKNKLDDHTIAPSENAWARVESGLSKKNKSWFVQGSVSARFTERGTVALWRWAAVVLLTGALLSVLYWTQRGNGSEKVLATEKLEAPKGDTKQQPESKSQPSDETIAQKKQPPVKAEKENSTGLTKQDARKETQEKSSTKKIMETEKALAQQYMIKLNNESLGQENRIDSNPELEEKIKREATPTTEVASSKQKPIKLEFTLEALPSEETVATTTEAKSTGIKKMLNLAREMKEGEGLSLREKKDELLAHNFLTKKERNQ